MENLEVYMPQSASGKAVLITGGTTGIGRATAILLARMGAKVMVFGRYEQELNDALKDIKAAASGEVYGFTADIAREDEIVRIFEEVDKHFDRLDVLVNNAALGYSSVTEGIYKDWEYIVKTNLLGYLACSAEAIKRMRIKKEGHIINIGSMSADVREVNSSVYVATKSGIQGFCESLRKEVNKEGIKVTLIEPGAVDTDMQQQSTEEKHQKVKDLKMLTADDIAMAVLYSLCQPKRCDVVELKVRPHLQEI